MPTRTLDEFHFLLHTCKKFRGFFDRLDDSSRWLCRDNVGLINIFFTQETLFLPGFNQW